MEDLFSKFLNKLVINRTKSINETIDEINKVFKIKNIELSENQKVKIVEKIYIISNQLKNIDIELNDLLININNLNNIEIPIDISSKLYEEIQFKENMKELLPIYCYLFYLKLLEN